MQKFTATSVAGALALIAFATPAAAQRTTPVTVENSVDVVVDNTVDVRSAVRRIPATFQSRFTIPGDRFELVVAEINLLVPNRSGDPNIDSNGPVPPGFVFALTSVQVERASQSGLSPEEMADDTAFSLFFDGGLAPGAARAQGLRLSGKLFSNSTFNFDEPAMAVVPGSLLRVGGTFISPNPTLNNRQLLVTGSGYFIRQDDIGRE